MKKLNILLLGILVGFAFVSCNDDDPIKIRRAAVRKLYSQNNTVKIAVANSYEKYVSSEWNGLNLAAKIIEEENLLGKHLELIKYDDGGDSIQGSNTAYKIAADTEISAVIGHGYSDISIPAATIYQYYGILMFNTSSTAPKLTMNNNPYVVRNISNDNMFGKKAAELCAKKGFSRVLIYYLNMASANSLANSFEFNSMGKNITVVSRESYELTTLEEDLGSIFDKWKNNFIFDAILLAGTNPSIGTVVKEIRNNGITCPIIGADSFDDEVFVRNLPESEKGNIFAVSNFCSNNKSENYKLFRDRYVSEFNSEPDYEALHSYDALMVLAKAIKEADSSFAEDFVKVLKGKQWTEAAGPYSFNEDGDVNGLKLYEKVFNGTEFVECE